MSTARIAERYAKSLIDLSIEHGKLEEVYTDALYIKALCKKSPEFAMMLKSPIIKGDKKAKVINEISKGRFSELSRLFLNLLVRKGRERFLRDIMVVVCERYDAIKGISRINLVTAAPISDALKTLIVDKIKSDSPLTQIELKTKVDESLVGGFVLEYNNYLADRSIKRFLNEVKKLYAQNQYQYNIR